MKSKKSETYIDFDILIEYQSRIGGSTLLGCHCKLKRSEMARIGLFSEQTDPRPDPK